MNNHPTLALGTMQFLWTTTGKEAYEILDEYYELGGRIIDTADMYTNWVPGLRGGEAETIIGKWMKLKKNRSELTLMSKVGAKVWEGKDGDGLSMTHIVKAIEKSLQRLQTDYVDIYISHWSDPNTPIAETLGVYGDLIKEGKVEAIGCSNYSPDELSQAMEVGKDLGTSYTYLQAYYNLIDRTSFEEGLLPLIKKFHLRTFIYGPLASGFLSGAFRKEQPLREHARSEFVKQKMTEENFRILETVEEIGKKYGATVPQIALAWLLQKGYTPIIGADNASQVKENMGAREVILCSKDIDISNNLISK